MTNGKVKLDLAAHGFGDQWIELHDPKFYSERHFLDLATRLQRIKDGAAESNEDEQFLREQVAAWHLRDADTGADLVNPATDDLKGLPRGVTKLLIEEIFRLFFATVPRLPTVPS